MTKTKVRIIVQGSEQIGYAFGQELSKYIEMLESTNVYVQSSLQIQYTSSSNGRQTACMQWLERETIDTKPFEKISLDIMQVIGVDKFLTTSEVASKQLLVEQILRENFNQ